MRDAGLDGDDAHRVGHHVVQVAGDPQPLRGDRPARLIGLLGHLAVGFVELVSPPSPAGPQVLPGQPGHGHRENRADPRGRRRHGRRLQQERDAQTDDAAEVHDQRPATTRVQGDEEHQDERRVPGERGEAAQRVSDHGRGRGQHRDDRISPVDRDRGRDESRQT